MNNHEHIKTAKSILDNLRRKQKNIEIVSMAFYILSIVFFVSTAAMLLEVNFLTPSNVRLIMAAIFLIILLASIVFNIIGINRDVRLKRDFRSEKWWALAIGAFAARDVRDRLHNAITINEKTPNNRDGFSIDLARKALYDAIAEIKDVRIEDALDHTKKSKSLKTLAFAFVLFAFNIVIMPNSSLSALNRLAHPSHEFIQPVTFDLEIEPQGGWVYNNEPVKFDVQAFGTPPEKVNFFFHYDGGDIQKESVTLANGTGSLEFDGFDEPVNYWAGWKDIATGKYRLTIVSRPRISLLQYRLIPPKYTRLPAETGKENIGNIEALPGSRSEISIQSTKYLDKAWFVFSEEGADSTENDSLEMKVAGKSAFIEYPVYKEGKYHVRLIDEDSHKDRDPVVYKINVLTDDFPSVRIAFPEVDVDLGDNMILPLKVEADDDYGIARIDLQFKTLNEDTAVHREQLALEKPNHPSVEVDHFWNLGDLYLMPGDVVEYWTVAYDNDAVHGPKSAESEHRMVRLPSLEEIFAAADETEETGFEQAEQALESAEELKEAVDEIIQEMRQNPEVDWEKRQQIQDALERQEDVQQQMENLKKTVEELTQRLEKFDLAEVETLEKYKELQDLIAEIATPEMKEAMEKLKEAMESQDPDQIRQALEEFDLDRESFKKNIERSMEILKQLQLERRLDELVKQVEEILNDQEEVLAEMDASENVESALKERQISNKMKSFEQRLQEAAELASENGEEQLADELDSLAADAASKKIPENMQAMSQDLLSGSQKEARDKGEENARNLAALSSALSNSATNLKERRKNELARKIRRLVEEVLYLSQNQEELYDLSEKISAQSPRYRSLASRQDDIKNALSELTDRVFEVGKETFFITPQLGASLGKASQEIDQAIERYISRNPRSVSTPQRNALGEMNSSGKQLLDILSQLKSSSSSSGYEEMLERLSQMAQQQQGLNQQSMPMPGPGGQQQMPGGQQLSQLAAQQRALQEKMKQLGEDAQGMQEILGDLEGVSDAMGEVSDDLENQNVTKRTRRLQRQIVSRLLDATRSAKQKEYSKKRESKAGEDLTRKSPPPIQLDSDKEKLRQDLKRALQEGYTRDYRRLIRSYFQALEEIKDVEGK